MLNYLLTENGVDPAEVDIQWKTADEVSALMVSGEARLCMMPVPAATAIVVVVSATTTAAGRAAEVAVERRHVLGISCICLAILFVILGIGINL